MKYDFENDTLWWDEEWNAHHDQENRAFKSPNKDTDDFPSMKNM